MGWSPNSNKSLVLGNLTRKGIINDEELENLREYAPKKPGEERSENLRNFNETVAQEILAQGQSAVNASLFLDELANDDIFFDVYSDNIKLDIATKISDPLYSDWDVTLIDVYSVMMKKELTPDNFYFGIKQNTNGDMYTIITPIEIWERNGSISDKEYSTYVVPDFLTKITEYEYSWSDRTPGEFRLEMLNLGFIEKHDM